MDRNHISVHTHFHIHWGGKESWDWESFKTIPEAMARAADLARPGEMLTFEEASAECPVCRPKTARTNWVKEKSHAC